MAGAPPKRRFLDAVTNPYLIAAFDPDAAFAGHQATKRTACRAAMEKATPLRA